MRAREPITRERIVAEAMEWLGTPFHWQASVKKVGCDCKGLIAGVARELGMPEAQSLYGLAHDYRQDFRPDDMLEGLQHSLRPTAAPQAGDIMAMEIAGMPGPRHLGILTGTGRIIHCYGAGPRQVISAPIGRSRKVHSYWTWPSLGEAE